MNSDSMTSMDCESTTECHEEKDSRGNTHQTKEIDRKCLFTWVILLLGTAASAAFLSVGITGTIQDKEAHLEHESEELAHALEIAWQNYVLFGLWIHQSCVESNERNNAIPIEQDVERHLGLCSRQEFRDLYEHIASQGVKFQAAQLVPNITHAERSELERQSRLYYNQSYPDFKYRGITMLDYSESKLVNRTEEPFYWPVHYVEPLEGNENAVDLDVYSFATSQKFRVHKAVEMFQPVLSDRLVLVQETETNAYGVVLMHPGVPTSTSLNIVPRAIAQIVIRIPDFIALALPSHASYSKAVYLFDSTESSSVPQFLGAVHAKEIDGKAILTTLPEVDFTQAHCKRPRLTTTTEIAVADRRWTFVVVFDETDYNVVYIIIGGVTILLASVLLAVWFRTHMARVAKYNQLRSRAEAEKAETARKQVARERHLNEFMAHEVRNPLSSAISALAFVSSTVNDSTQCTIQDEGTRKTLRQDLRVMDASLQFINELLRNLLDVTRCASKQMKLEFTDTDVLLDILEPVAAVLYLRGAAVDVKVECPEDLVVETDRMRLKQIVLNLSANATKFVERGFICLQGKVVNGSIEISVMDSGPGIPVSKRGKLFAKFQESLDSLNQGTGIGLAVCKDLSELMGADISLDETYDSGIDGYPGTRFVLRLNKPPQTSIEESSSPVEELCLQDSPTEDLPANLSVLFVDDDTILRKMFIRALKRAAPDWDVQEASNGETALQLVDSHNFDLIFMDHYMASVEKQLLGTETVRAMRSKGVTSIICGLSANDMEKQFFEAGSDAFMFKPFPCEREALCSEILSILKKRPNEQPS